MLEEPTDIEPGPAQEGQAWMMQDETIEDGEFIDEEDDLDYYHDHPAVKKLTEPETHYVTRGPAYRNRTGPIQLSPDTDVTGVPGYRKQVHNLRPSRNRRAHLNDLQDHRHLSPNQHRRTLAHQHRHLRYNKNNHMHQKKTQRSLGRNNNLH
eukprot:g58966.t1